MLALLEGSRRPRAGSMIGGRSPSPYTNTPRSPVRSMLDIGDEAPAPSSTPSSPIVTAKKSGLSVAPVRSMLDIDSPQVAAPTRSMLDKSSPPVAAPAKHVLSNPASPVEPNFRARHGGHPRSMSDAAAKPVDFGPRAAASRFVDPTADYQFSGIITNHAGLALPKRVSQGGKRAQTATSMMAEVMRGSDVGTLALPGERGRHSVSGPTSRLSSKSKSPHAKQPGLRNKSPQNNLLSGRHLSPAGRAVLDEAQALDFHNAYRRLSDANLAFSGGSLSELSRRKRSVGSSDPGRLEKDYLGPDGEMLPDDSSDENAASSSEDEDNRGRKAARTSDTRGGSETGSKSPETTRQSLSLLAAAEAERMFIYLPFVTHSLADRVNRNRGSEPTTQIPIPVLIGGTGDHSYEPVR